MQHQKKLVLSTPTDFSFWRTVLSHGWCVLAPFSLDRRRRLLERTLKVRQQAFSVQMRAKDSDRLEILVQSRRPILKAESREIESQVITMLRLDESMQEFYSSISNASNNGALDWICKVKTGRLLRSPSLFEDILKMICTTNCTWSATERMVTNLVQKVGARFDGELACFPSPEELAAVSEEFLLKEARTGYRSAYLIELATCVASGKLDLDHLSNERDKLYQQLTKIKGIGPYAAGNLLKLLGHYDFLALDSWCRQRFSQLYRAGKKVTDQAIARKYKRYGRWQGLVMWLELTQEWFDEE